MEGDRYRDGNVAPLSSINAPEPSGGRRDNSRSSDNDAHEGPRAPPEHMWGLHERDNEFQASHEAKLLTTFTRVQTKEVGTQDMHSIVSCAEQHFVSPLKLDRCIEFFERSSVACNGTDASDFLCPE